MITNILLIILLGGLIGGLFVSISRRKRMERQQLEELVVDQKHVMEKSEMASSVTSDAVSKRIKQLRTEFTYSKTEGHLINYAEYHMKFYEFLLYALGAGIFFFLIGILFYSNLIIALVVALLGVLYPGLQRKKLLEKRKEQLRLQFKEAIASLSSSLAAGRSTENSFRDVLIDLQLLYPDPNTHIIREFKIINSRVENGETIERAIQDFAFRSDVEDIKNFADVFITCKRTGGDLVEVIRRTSDIISEKIDIQQEVSVLIAQKRFESKILSIIPIGMIMLLKYSSGGYMDPLYDWRTIGPFIMTACLGLLIFSYWLGQRIMDIEV